MAEQSGKSSGPVRGVANQNAWIRWILQTARTWSDVREVIRQTGIATIDADHRRMTEIALEVSNLIDLYQGSEWKLSDIEEEGRIIHELYDCAASHFMSEEAIIQKYELPLFDVQKKQHAAFLKNLSTLIDDFERGRLTVTLNLKSSVLEWWINHINETDYQTFCTENWIGRIAAKAHAWEDIETIIKPTGIGSVDQQHQSVALLALQFVDFAAAHQDDFPVGEALSRFDAFLTAAKEHFIFEEEFTAFYDIPDAARNEHDHKRFLARMEEWRTKINTGAFDDVDLFREHLLFWWVTHINDIDHECLSLERWGDLVFSSRTPPERAMEFVKQTGVQAVNEDHERITRYILKIEDIISRFETDEAHAETLGSSVRFFDELYGFCEAHFKREIGLMEAAGYPAMAEHIRQHTWFLNHLKRHRNHFAEGRVTASKALKRSLLEWWMTHIRDYDIRAFGTPEIKLNGGAS